MATSIHLITHSHAHFLMIPWIKKYAPKRKEDIVGQDSQMAQLEAFIAGFKQAKKNF